MYFKITNQEECHHGYQYQTGLNILDRPFEKEGSCVKGGLYFTNLEYLHEFYEYGVWIRVITIPEDAEMVMDSVGHKWRANKIILGAKYPLFDVETILKFDLKINPGYIDRACGAGCDVNVLEWWKNSGFELNYSESAINWASNSGHVEVLEWWKNSGLELKYNNAINYASENGHVKVLEWWLKANKETGLKLKYSHEAINYASKNNHVDILEWWLEAHKSTGLELRYTSFAIDRACENGHPNVLKWWIKFQHESDLKIYFTSYAMRWTPIKNREDVRKLLNILRAEEEIKEN